MITTAPFALIGVLLACVGLAALAAHSGRRFRPSPESVTTGELRDRLFARAFGLSDVRASGN